MDDTSFDPRSWGKPKGKTGSDSKSPESKGESLSGEKLNPFPAGKGSDPAAPGNLPEAWQSVRTSVRLDAIPDAPPATERGSRARPLGIAAAMAVVLAGGGYAGWQWQQAPAPTEAVPAPIAAAPAPALPASETATPAAPTEVERGLTIARASELAAALSATGVATGEANAAARAAAGALTAPGEIRATIIMLQDGKSVSLQRMQASYQDGSGAVVTRSADGSFSSRSVVADLTRQIKVLRGELDSESFFTSAVSAGLIDTLIPEFINAFGFDFNLASEVAPGDTFQVAYEQSVNAGGEAVGAPKLLLASLTTKTKSLTLYRFVNSDGSIGWYDGNGASTRRGLMRTPVDGARISSKFGPRFHPVLRYTRLHGGTDFAAPVGTPIYAASAGVITSASPSRCAGNMVIMRHDNGWETRYFHLSRYADGLTAGLRVEQGFTIGLVGNTGTCTTGPHLHYEVHIDGQKVDPLSIKTDDATRKRMDGTAMAAFLRERDRIDVARAHQSF